MFRNNLLLIGTVISLSACSGSSDNPSTINESNASLTTKAMLQQVTGVAKHAQLASSKKSSGKSTVKAGITIEQSLTTSTPSCSNSGQDNMRYIVNSDISLDCDFLVKASSRLEINDASFTVSGDLVLDNVIGTGDIEINANKVTIAGKITNSSGSISIAAISNVVVEGGVATANILNGNATFDNGLQISATGSFGTAQSLVINGAGQVALSEGLVAGGPISVANFNVLSTGSTLQIDNACNLTASSKSQPRAGITIEQGLTDLDVYYADCPKTASSSESSGTGITIAQNFSDLLVSLCLNTDGSASFDYDDSNSNNILDLGETSHANYTNCQFSDTLSFDGKQSTAVSEFFPGYKAIMVSDSYSVTENGKTLTSNGTISLSASDADGTQRFRAEFTELNESSGLESTTLHSGFIESSFSNASYEIQQDIFVSGSSLVGRLSIKTEPNLKGAMLNGELQPPHSGQLKATAEDGSYIIMNADDGDNNRDTFNLTVSNGAAVTTVKKWSEL